MATNYAALSSDVRTFIAQKTLKIAHKAVRFYEFGTKEKLPPQHGKSFQYTRYERLALPQTTITDGITPSDTSMSVNTVTAVAEQWGAVVTITDVAELTIAHKPLQKAIELQGKQAAETIDREIYKVVSAGTNVFYGDGSVSSRATTTTGMVTNEAVLKKIVASLRDYGADGMEKPETAMDDPELGDLYIGIVDPFTEMDIVGLANFREAARYADAKRLFNGEIGEYLGVRYVRSNMIPTLTSAAAPSVAQSTGGSLADATYKIVVTGVDNTFGYEKVIYQEATQAVSAGGGTASIDVTIPSTTGFTYNVYMTAAGGASGSEKLHSTGAAPAATVNITTVPTGVATPALLNAAGSKIHQSFFIGKEAYTVVNLANLQSTITPPGESESDPLAQRRKVGWKTMFKAVINNQNFLARYEHESSND